MESKCCPDHLVGYKNGFMKRSIRQSLEEFKLHWKNYVIQSLCATFAVYLLILFLTLQDAIVVASIGATTFVVFAMPNSISAQPKNLIGGYLVGLGCGLLCLLIPKPQFLDPSIANSFIAASAIGLSIFVMVVTDTEHPAASGLALAVAMNGFSWRVVIAAIISALALSFIHVCFKRFLRDLT